MATTEKEIHSKQVFARESRQRIFYFLVILAGIIFQLSWIGVAVYREVTTPTQQLKSMLALMDYVSLPESKRTRFIKKLEDDRLFLWPAEGVAFSSDVDFDEFTEKMNEVLLGLYGDEYRNLAEEERDLLRVAFINIVYDIKQRWDEEFIVSTARIKELNDKPEISLRIGLAFDQVKVARFRWNGYQSNLYYLAVIEDSEHFRIYLCTISDLAEKIHFIRQIYIPFSILLLITIGAIYYVFLVTKRQEQVSRIQSALGSSHLFRDLAENLHISLNEIARCKTVSLYLLYEDSCFVFRSGEYSGQSNEVVSVKTSPPGKRMEILKQNNPDMFIGEETGRMVLSVVIKSGETVRGFIDIEFPLGGKVFKDRITGLVVRLVPSLLESYFFIQNRSLETKDKLLLEYRQKIFDNRELSPVGLFARLKEKLSGDSGSEILPAMKNIWLFRYEGGNVLPPFGIGEFFQPEEKAGSGLSLQDMSGENSQLYYQDASLYLILKIHAPGEELVALAEFEKVHENLSLITLEFMETVFNEFLLHITNYHHLVSRDLVKNEMVELATEMQPEVKEILEQKTEEFFSQNPVYPYLSDTELKNQLMKLPAEYFSLKAQGYGYHLDVDLHKSEEIRKQLPEDQGTFYESCINDTNKFVFEEFGGKHTRFLTAGKSGGDGDGLRYFVTSLNTRACCKPGEEIGEGEKNDIDMFIVNNSVNCLLYGVSSNIPMKFALFLLEDNLPINLGFDKGALKIDSYMTGLVERARFEKGYRITSSGEPVLLPGYKYSRDSVEIVEAPKRIFQPYSLVFPERTLGSLKKFPGISGFVVERFFVPDYSFENPASAKASGCNYYEVRLSRKEVFDNMVPYLNKIPANLDLEELKNILSALQENTVATSVEELLHVIAAEHSVTMESLEFFLDPVLKEVHYPGIYMVLEKSKAVSMPMTGFREHLQVLQNSVIPKLEYSREFAAGIIRTEQDWKTMSGTEKTAALEQLNRNLADYRNKIQSD